jgi:hypothetical protein
MGRLREAETDAARAASVDPLSPAIAVDYGNILLWLGDTGGAEAQFDRARSLEFGYAPALLGSALVALEEEQEVELQMALTQWSAVSGVAPGVAPRLASGMLTHRQTGEPQSAPEELAAYGRAGTLSAGTLALLHALVGDDGEALAWLEASVDDRSWIDQYLRVNPAYDGLRGDDDFNRLLEELGA